MQIEVGKVYRARNGSLRRVVCVDAHGPYPIVSVAVDPSCMPHVLGHTSTGAANNLEVETPYDLIAKHREPMKRTLWLVKFNDGSEFTTPHKDEADTHIEIHPGTIHRGTWVEETP